MASARFSGNTDSTVPVAKVYREASYELMEPTAYAYCISWNITSKASLWSILYPLAVMLRIEVACQKKSNRLASTLRIVRRLPAVGTDDPCSDFSIDRGRPLVAF